MNPVTYFQPSAAGITAALLVVLQPGPAPAQGFDLQGVWKHCRVNECGKFYSSTVTVDTKGSANDVTKCTVGGCVEQSGYVVDGDKVEIVFTSAVYADPRPYNPDHFSCTVESDQAFNCSNKDTAGSVSHGFAVVRGDIGTTCEREPLAQSRAEDRATGVAPPPSKIGYFPSRLGESEMNFVTYFRPGVACITLAVLAALQPGLARAQGIDMQGVWEYVRINQRGNSFSGNITIDAKSNARDVTKLASGAFVAQAGYVAVNGGKKIEIIFTSAVPSDQSKYNPDHFYCTIQSDRALSCTNTDTAGSASDEFALVRVGKRLNR